MHERQIAAPAKEAVRAHETSRWRCVASRLALAGGLASLAVLVATAVPAAAASGPSAMSSHAAASVSGWLRFAHFVSSEPPVDVDVDGSSIGTDIAFRDVTGYVPVHSGANSVVVTSTSGARLATTTADVPAGGAVTVAAFASTGVTTSGTGSVAGGVTLQVFDDNLSAPPDGYAKVRVIHTIPGAPVVDTSLTSTTPGSETPTVELGAVGYKQVSAYVPVFAGTYDVKVETTTKTVVTQGLDWQAVAGRVVTIVIVEATSGPTLEILSDAAGAGTTPNGAMQTGFGGTAPKGPPVWLVTALAAAMLLLLAAALALRVRMAGRPAAATGPP